MAKPKSNEKIEALAPLAMGQSRAATARQVGVSSATVGRWLSQPVFAEEVARLEPFAKARPVDGERLLAEIEASRARIEGMSVDADGRVRTHLLIPAYATEVQRRRIIAKAMAKSAVAALKARS